MNTDTRSPYEPPTITTYTEDDILEALGPAGFYALPGALATGQEDAAGDDQAHSEKP